MTSLGCNCAAYSIDEFSINLQKGDKMIKAGFAFNLIIGCDSSDMSMLDGVHFVCMRKIKRLIGRIC